MGSKRPSKGLRLDDDTWKKLDDVVGNFKDLGINRNELIESILKAFFKINKKPNETAKKIIILKRNGEL